jgi:hypothetical protein
MTADYDEDEFGSTREPARIGVNVGPGDFEGNDLETDPLGVSVVNWRELTDAEAPAVWRELGDWVAWLVFRYAIPANVISNCWFKHGGAVEELSALHACWLASFDSTDSGYGPIGFHERLELAQSRIKRLLVGCQSDHYDSRTRIERLDADWSEWITSSRAT